MWIILLFYFSFYKFLFAYIPTDLGVYEEVDVVEVNHYHHDSGKIVLDQVVFWEWSTQYSRYQVRDWRLLKSKFQRPVRDHKRGDYVTSWVDGTILRIIRSPSMRETWTYFDTEVENRSVLPRAKRRKLKNAIRIAESKLE